jgi:hypothetical protein
MIGDPKQNNQISKTFNDFINYCKKSDTEKNIQYWGQIRQKEFQLQFREMSNLFCQINPRVQENDSDKIGGISYIAPGSAFIL